MAMAAEHSDASSIIDECSSNSEDSEGLGFSVATEYNARSIEPYMHEPYASDDDGKYQLQSMVETTY